MDFKKINLSMFLGISLALLSVTMLLSCQPEEFSSGNGLSDDTIDPSFTITPVSGVVNRYTLSATSNTYIASKWDIGEGPYLGGSTEEIFLPDAGTYSIVHTAIGPGGVGYASTQELVVDESDPIAGNIVQGGKFETDDDRDQWTIHQISDTGAEWKLNDGSATIFSTSEWAQQGIYQEIEVVKDKKYSIDMLVSGGGGFMDTWFEVYAGTSAPVPGTEYSDTKIMGLSTWDGCGIEAFDGRLSSVGCVKNSSSDSIDNTVTFAQSGTIYLYIRSGGRVFNPSGITIRNVEMRGAN